VSTPGWYPDPGGRPGHYRLWNGESWGLSTTSDPPGGPSTGPPPPRRRRVAPWIVAGAVLLVVLAVVGALVIRDQNRTIVDYGPSPTATGGVDAPTTTPSAVPSPSPTPTSPSPGDSPGDTASPVPCPVGNPFSRQDYPRDGRVHGGNLSFPRQSGWEDPGQQASAFTWAYDVGDSDRRVQPQSSATYAVGALSVADGFEDPQSAAELSLQCTIHSALYSYVTSRTDLVDEGTTIDGYPAWTLRSELRTYDDRTSYGGDTVQITVVDLGSPESLAFFWGSAPLGDAALTARLDQVVEQLKVG
jgi:hypothetical protein